MNIFVDTEFSSLGSDPRLLSIALVTENGAELYIEFSSGWTFEQCSPWVKNHVLPLLGQGLALSRAARPGRLTPIGRYAPSWLQPTRAHTSTVKHQRRKKTRESAKLIHSRRNNGRLSSLVKIQPPRLLNFQPAPTTVGSGAA